MWLDIHALILSLFGLFENKTLNTSIQYTEWRKLGQGNCLEYSMNWNRWDNFNKQEIMLRLCCKERLDKVVDYNKSKEICTLPEARHAPTHARVNNHRLLSQPLWGVISKETNRG